MRVVCPSCNAAYNVPEASFTGGQRRLRCARCQTEWVAATPLAEAVAAAPLVAIPAAATRAAEPVAARPEAAAAAGAADIAAAPAAVATQVRAESRLDPPGAAPLMADQPLAAARTADGDLGGLRTAPASGAGNAGEEPTSRRSAAGRVILAWLLSLVVLGLIGAAVVIWRKDVVRVWPPSERAYLLLGLR